MSKKKKREEQEPAELAAAETPRETAAFWQIAVAGALLIAFAFTAYSNTFRAPFLFDDDMHIVNNTAIRRIDSDAMFKHPNTTRPVIGLTLALNFNSGALDPFHYHVFNFATHVLAGLLLFGIARRTFESERLRGRFGSSALPLAFAIALLWTVHPLHTQAVTYIIQRCESLMGFFYLLTLYCVIRGSQSPYSIAWYAASVASCALGMGCKQVMFFAPVVVFLYDRTFLSGSFLGAIKQRWGLYAPLAATSAIPFVLLQYARSDRSVGFKSGLTPWTYLLMQAEVIPHYLRLALVPAGQCFVYKDWPIAQSIGAVALPGLLMLSLVGAWFWGLIKNHPAGFLGTWFFLILAPSSSVMPIIDPAFEYRMYLSLASLTAGVAVLSYFLFERLFTTENELPRRNFAKSAAICLFSGIIAAGLTVATFQRNKVYENKITLWKDVVEKRPKSIPGWANYGEALLDTDVAGAEHAFRTAMELDASEHAAKGTKRDAPELYSNLGNALDKLGRREDALKAYETALEIRPDAAAYNNLGDIMMRQNRIPDAIDYFKRALKVKPEHTDSLYNLAKAYYDIKEYDDAAQTFEKLIKLRPEYAKAYTGLGGVHFIRNDFKKAAEYFTEAQKRDPQDRDILRNLALALYRDGQHASAEAKFKEVLRLHPGYAEAHASYAELLTAMGRTKEAEEEYKKLGTGGNDFNREMTLASFYKKQGNQLEFEKHLEAALKADPKHAAAQFDLGTALLARGKVPEAIEHLKIAAELNPKDLRARVALGNAYSNQGKFAEAIAEIEKVVQADPGQTELRVGLGKLLTQANRPADAAAQFREAARLNPNAVEPLLELGWLLNDNKTIGDPKAALEIAEKAAATAPKDARPQELLGAVSVKLGKVEAAISALEKGIELAKAAGDNATAAGLQQQLDSVKKFLKKK